MVHKVFIPLLVFFLLSHNSKAQEPLKPRPSPLAMVTMKYHDNYVKITYGQPHKKGRDIFGDLVPYGSVWRTGANEATEITLTSNLLVNGELLEAGTYTLFSIPGKEKWTIIFNKDVGQWGAYNYNERSDALRVVVPTEKVENVVWEPFTIEFDQRNSEADMNIMWDQTKVSIPVNFTE
ncbi:MAG: DUF2911 domain-containing protein [Bacteroidota bacterium]